VINQIKPKDLSLGRPVVKGGGGGVGGGEELDFRVNFEEKKV